MRIKPWLVDGFVGAAWAGFCGGFPHAALGCAAEAAAGLAVTLAGLAHAPPACGGGWETDGPLCAGLPQALGWLGGPVVCPA